MSILLDIIQKLQATQDAIRKTRELVARYPLDYGLLVNLESLEARALSLEESFLIEADVEQLDVCTYRMFGVDQRNYPILTIGSAISDLQRWFSIVYDALRNGPKRRAKLSPEIVQQSTLDFAFTFTGSVGFAMTVPSERLLIDNDLQRAMQKTVEMAKAESSDQIHLLSKEVGSASIRAMYRWVSDHTSAQAGAEIRWLRDREDMVLALFEARHLVNLGRAIEETSDETEEVLELIGDMVGADINKHTFHLAFEEADEIRGTMADSIGVQYTVELPKRYLAVIRKTSFINYATDEEYTKYHLLELKNTQQ
jgi:hypothetical protein